MGLSEPVQKPAEAEHIDLRTFEKRSHTPFPTHFQVLTVTGKYPEFSAFLPEVTGFSTNNKGLAINCSWMRRIQIGENACLDQVPKKNFQPKQPLSPKALPRGRALPPKKATERQSGANQPHRRTASVTRTVLWDLKRG